MIKGHTDIDIWNTGFFINADYFCKQSKIGS